MKKFARAFYFMVCYIPAYETSHSNPNFSQAISLADHHHAADVARTDGTEPRGAAYHSVSDRQRPAGRRDKFSDPIGVSALRTGAGLSGPESGSSLWLGVD